MKIAIVGSGIAGNVVAHHLHRAHDITVFESAAHIGGHTHTHDIELDGERHQIDTERQSFATEIAEFQNCARQKISKRSCPLHAACWTQSRSRSRGDARSRSRGETSVSELTLL